jgi:4-amino-4-deoxy-L-arabinose transferase-like glycosyltransferase
MGAPAIKPDSVKRNAAGDLNPRVFWLVLLLTALIGLVVRIEIGRKTFISFDEWQHVFMASSARWTDLSFELRTNAHPPLFFLLLKAIVRLGNIALYRSISIAAGVGSIVAVGLIARRLLDSPILQLLCAAVFALSTDAISVSVEIRSYLQCS